MSLAARRIERLQKLVEDIRTTNGKAQAISMDVSVSKSVAAGFDEAKNHFGAVDVAINSAATAGRGPSVEVPAEEWLRIIDVNLNGAWYVAQQAGKQVIESGNGGSFIDEQVTRKISGALLLLCSDASGFMTGSTITVDGGHLLTSL